MNDVVKQDITKEIAALLVQGESPSAICKKLKIEENLVYGVMSGQEFAALCMETLDANLRSATLFAVRNIIRMADDEKISAATRLKANQYLVDKAKEIEGLGGSDLSPSTMSQDQLARRLNELQKEAIKRAKPIDTGVDTPNLDDMLD